MIILADIFATIIFSYIGFLACLEKTDNIIVVIVCGYFTSFMGGIIRDIFILKQIPMIFLESKYMLIIPPLTYFILTTFRR